MARLSERYGEGRQVFTLPMPGLADLVETGEVEGARVEAMLRIALKAPLSAGADAVALGCTHYGFLRDTLAELLPDGVQIIDAADPVARRARQILAERGYTPDPAAESRPILCYATGDPADFEATITRLRQAGADLPALSIGRPVA